MMKFLRKTSLILAALFISANASAYTINGNLRLMGSETLTSGQQINLDVTGNTGLRSPSAGIMELGANTDILLTLNGNVNRVEVDGTLEIVPTNRLQFDAIGDTYTDLPAPGILRTFVGANSAFVMQRTASTIVGFGLNGNGTNPGTLFPGADLVVGNSTDAQSRAIVIQNGNNFNGNILFSDTTGSANGSIVYSHSANELGFNAASGGMTMRTNGELGLPTVDPPTANFSNSNGNAKAWLYMQATGTTPFASYNIDAITHTNGTGLYSITFDTDFASSNYACVTSGVSGNLVYAASIISASNIQVQPSTPATGVGSDSPFYMICYGAQ